MAVAYPGTVLEKNKRHKFVRYFDVNVINTVEIDVMTLIGYKSAVMNSQLVKMFVTVVIAQQTIVCPWLYLKRLEQKSLI